MIDETGPADISPAGCRERPLAFEFALSEQDYVRANMLLSRGRIRRSAWIFGTLSAGFALMVLAGSLPPEYMVWILPVVYGINAVTLYPMTRYRLRKQFRGGARLQAVARVELSADGYRTDSGGTDLFVRWEVFSHFDATETGFLLYLGPENALVLPTSAVDEPRRADVRQILNENIGRTRSPQTGRGFPVAVSVVPVEPPQAVPPR